MGRLRRGRGLLAGALAAPLIVAALLVPPRSTILPQAEAAAQPQPRIPPAISLDLRYVEDNDPAHRLDLFVPGGYTTARPLVVFVHGGSWTHGSKRAILGGTSQRADVFRDLLLSEGYAVASVEYRFSQVARFPAQLHDVKAAVRYLRTRADELHLDPSRFAAAGESAGGHLAQMLGYTGAGMDRSLEGDLGETGVSSRVSAVVSYYGESDLSRVVSDRIASGCPRGDHGVASSRGRLTGVDPESPTSAAVVRRASPATYVGVTSPPTLLLHGTRDCLVPARQSASLYRLLKRYGVTTDYVAVDAPHGGPAFHTTPRISYHVVAFLDEVLGRTE